MGKNYISYFIITQMTAQTTSNQINQKKQILSALFEINKA